MDLANCMQRLVVGTTSMDQRSMFGNACKCCSIDYRNTEKIRTIGCVAVLEYVQDNVLFDSDLIVSSSILF